MFGGSASRAPRAQIDLKRAYDAMVAMKDKDDFAGAEPIHLVVLYLELHLRVYGVEAADCTGSDRVGAIARAKDFVRDFFDGSSERAVEFLRWTWQREKAREKWRRENNAGGKRITWRLQFSAALVTDYRLDQARKAKAAEG